MNIPNETWLQIFTFIPNDTFIIGKVCKQFLTILNNRKCNNINIIQNDSHLLAKYLLNPVSIGDPDYSTHGFPLMCSNIEHILTTLLINIYTMEMGSDMCVAIVGYYSYLHKLFSDFQYLLQFSYTICSTNNIKGVKCFSYPIPNILAPFNYFKYCCHVCLINKSYDVLDYLMNTHLQPMLFKDRNPIIDELILECLCDYNKGTSYAITLERFTQLLTYKFIDQYKIWGFIVQERDNHSAKTYRYAGFTALADEVYNMKL